jgi:hypothetical protein
MSKWDPRKPPMTLRQSQQLLDAKPVNAESVAFFAAGVAVLSALAAALTLGYQAILYLQDGYWTPFSATRFCADYLSVEWCAAPNNWLGLHKLIADLSPAGLILLLSVCVSSAAFACSDRHPIQTK